MKEYLYIPLCELATHLKAVSLSIFGNIRMCIAFLAMYVATLFAPFSGVLIFTCMLVILDWVFAVGYAILHKCVDSKKRWKLVSKIIAYFVFFFVIGGIDKYAPYLDGMTDVFVAIVLLKECVSIFANMKMLFPNVKILGIMESLFKNEMERKMSENRRYTENGGVYAETEYTENECSTEKKE